MRRRRPTCSRAWPQFHAELRGIACARIVLSAGQTLEEGAADSCFPSFEWAGHIGWQLPGTPPDEDERSIWGRVADGMGLVTDGPPLRYPKRTLGDVWEADQDWLDLGLDCGRKR